MGMKSRITRLEGKAGGTDNFSLISQQERIVAVSAYTEEEYQVKISERLAELHRKYGHFDESILTFLHIRKFSRDHVFLT